MNEANTENQLKQEKSTLGLEIPSDIFTIGSDRKILGFSIQHDPSLQAQHIVDIRTPRAVNTRPFEMWTSDDIRDVMKSKGTGLIKKLVNDDLFRVLMDPYGSTSIDPLKHDEEAQEQRTVNRASDDLEATLGLPVCIKGTGRDMSTMDPRMEDLIIQYQFMRRLALENTRLREVTTERLGYCPIKFLDVYGVISYPKLNTPDGDVNPEIQQFLLMERVINGKHVDQDPNKAMEYMFRFDDPESFDPRTGFFSTDHPGLAAYIGSDNEFIGWTELETRLKKDGFDTLPDLQPRNILYTTDENGKNNYVIIDQVPLRHKNQSLG